MARIRIVDEWLRSPASQPTRYRAIMVVADSWAEQRVMMRAYAEAFDQTRPTIVLHGAELAIGPAGVDPHGAWGIHVEPPADGRAQELKNQLEFAARRLAGSKGTPPRLLDEESTFDRKRTNHWAPGTPRDERRPVPGAAYYEPAIHGAGGSASQPHAGLAASDRPTVAAHLHAPSAAIGTPPPAQPVAAPAQAPAGMPPRDGGVRRVTPPAMTAATPRRRGWTSPVPVAPAHEIAGKPSGAQTVHGFASGSGAQTPEMRFGLARAPARRLAQMVGQTLPTGFVLSEPERNVLNALGEVDSLPASRVAQIVGVPDGAAWMDALMAKLADHGLDLIEPGDEIAGEPSYALRR